MLLEGSSKKNLILLASPLWEPEAALPSQTPQNTPSIPLVLRHQTRSIFLKPERDLDQLIHARALTDCRR